MKDLAAELNAIQREISATRSAILKCKGNGDCAALTTKLEKLESRYDELAAKVDKKQ